MKRVRPAARNDQMGRCATEYPACIAETARTWNKNNLAKARRRFRRIDDPANGFVARHKWIGEARKGRHVARPDQSFRTGTNTGPENLNGNVALLRRVECKAVKTDSPLSIE